MQVARDYAGMRALLIGCGSIGRRHGEVLLGLGVNDLAACDPEQAQRERMRELLPTIRLYGDYESALAEEKPDAAFVLTPTATHMAVAKAALLAGCHVFIEKPLANVSDGAQELVALARERGRNVMVGFCFRYHEALLRAKGMLEGGAIGRLVSIRALMGEHFPEVQPNYRNMYYARYSGAFELAHDLDLALWFANDQVEQVFSVYGAFSDIGIEAPDTVELLLSFKGRLAATVHLDFFQQPRRRQMELIGTDGVILVEFASWDEATISYYSAKARLWREEHLKTQRNDMFRAEDSEFLDAILGRGQIRCTVDEALKSLRVIESVYRPSL